MEKPVTDHEFEALMAQVLPSAPKAVAVACSGGPDSMALTFLTQRWSLKHGVAVTALIVDHGLRENSADEAARVAGWLRERGVSARILTSDRRKPDSNIQMEARSLRYAMISDWCASESVNRVLVAHHQDDQAETFLLRLARGSGVDGLSSMRKVSKRERLILLRPLLEVPKARLTATLEDAAWPSVSDPSNEKTDFARVRMRALLPALAREGLDAARLARTADLLADAAVVLDDAMQALLKDHVSLSDQGFALVDTEALAMARNDTASRLLSQLLSRIGGSQYPPRLDRIQRLLSALRERTFGSGRTAAGCRLILRDRAACADDNVLLICRETAAIAPQAAQPGLQVWDGRFEMDLAGDVSKAVIGPLGVEGWRNVVSLSSSHGRSPPGPAPVRRGLPGLWVEGRLAAAPSLGVYNPEVTAPDVVSCNLAPRLNALAGPFH